MKGVRILSSFTGMEGERVDIKAAKNFKNDGIREKGEKGGEVFHVVWSLWTRIFQAREGTQGKKADSRRCGQSKFRGEYSVQKQGRRGAGGPLLAKE